ncbi:MAG: oligoendopeptidase F [Tissierellia bacterium]|nr:oligoendopeptidase F [Tissierellia bacterium]
MELKKRADIPEELTWNTKDIFETEVKYNKTIESLVLKTREFILKYSGKLDEASTIVQSYDDYSQLMEILDLVGNYAYLNYSVDMTDSENQIRVGKAQVLQGELLSKLSFYESELLELDESVINNAMEINPKSAHMLKEILRKKPYALDPKVEEAISAFSPTFDSFYGIYETLKIADMTFPEFEVDGVKYPMSFVLHMNNYMFSTDTNVRRQAFQVVYKVLRQYENGLAANYNAHVQLEKTESKLRGYDSVIDFLLFSQNVDRDLYNRQIDIIMDELAPIMRKYAKLIQKTHGLEKMTYADLKVPLDSDFAPSVSIEEGWDYAKKALSVMGDEYLEHIKYAKENRWVDFAENIGKSTGGFCATPYGVHPYILLSWTGLLSEVFTLVHELGHGVHFIMAQKEHGILNCEPSLYLIEAPSTCNEMLLTNYLKGQSDDKAFKRWVMTAMIENTYYHNFVTHLLEAHYQREVYYLVDKGETLNADTLNSLKRATLEKFWGDAVEIEKGAELSWMIQPHYFMGLYPYTYSAGLTISTVASQRILNEGQVAVNDWLAFLKAGGVMKPLEMARIAGVDISTDKPLRETIAFIGEMVDEVIELSK